MAVHERSDQDLVNEAKTGSDAAFAALYVRYERAVRARCFGILRDHDEAADAAQNTMLSALRALRRGDAPTNVRAWLLSIAHNEAVSLLRRSRPSEPLEADATGMHKRRVGREHGWLGFALPGVAVAWLEALTANLSGVGKAALLAGVIAVGGGAASQLDDGGGGLLSAAVPPTALASPPRAQASALDELPRHLVPEPVAPSAALQRADSAGDDGATRVGRRFRRRRRRRDRPARRWRKQRNAPARRWRKRRDGPARGRRRRRDTRARRHPGPGLRYPRWVSFPGTAKPVRFEPAIWPPRPAPAPPQPKPGPAPTHER
jgi:RNA polymerase sigma factor (sigma-70 family)